MGNSCSLNILCCRKRHLIKLKIDTQSEIDNDYTPINKQTDEPTNKSRSNQNQTNSKPKERIFKATQKQDHDQFITKDEQTSQKLVTTKFKLKIPNLICRRRNADNQTQGMEIEAEKTEYLQQSSRNQFRAVKYFEKQKNYSQVQANHKKFDQGNDTSSTKNLVSQQNSKKSNLKNRGKNQKGPHFSKSDERNKLINLGKIHLNKDEIFQTHESPFDNQERFFEESINSDGIVTEERLQIGDKNSNTQFSPLRIGRLHLINDNDNTNKNYFFNQRSSQNDDSFAFDSVSQSLCTDLEAWNKDPNNRVFDSNGGNNTQREKCVQNNLKILKNNQFCEKSSMIHSNSYENLFSPDSNFVLTASHDSHESLTQQNNKGENSQNNLSNENHIQQFLDFIQKNQQIGMEKITLLKQQKLNFYEKKFKKIQQKQKQNLTKDQINEQKLIQQLIDQYQLKTTFSRETVQIRKTSQILSQYLQIQPYIKSDDAEQELISREKVIEQLQQFTQVILRGSNKICQSIFEHNIISHLIELQFKELKQKSRKKTENEKKTEIILHVSNNISLLVSQQRSLCQYVNKNQRLSVQLFDLVLLSLKENSQINQINENLIKLLLALISSKSIDDQNRIFSNYMLFSSLPIKLYEMLKQINNQSLHQNTLMIIKILKLLKALIVNFNSYNVGGTDEHSNILEIFACTEMLGVFHLTEILAKDRQKLKSQSIETIEEIILEIAIQVFTLNISFAQSLCKDQSYFKKLIHKINNSSESQQSDSNKILLQSLLKLSKDQSRINYPFLNYQILDQNEQKIALIISLIGQYNLDKSSSQLKELDIIQFLEEQLSQYEEYDQFQNELNIQIFKEPPKSIFINILQEYKIDTDLNDKNINLPQKQEECQKNNEISNNYLIQPPLSTKSAASLRSSMTSRMSIHSNYSAIFNPKINLKDFIPFPVAQQLQNQLKQLQSFKKE